jgi:hypothetical protein
LTVVPLTTMTRVLRLLCCQGSGWSAASDPESARVWEGPRGRTACSAFGAARPGSSMPVDSAAPGTDCLEPLPRVRGKEPEPEVTGDAGAGAAPPVALAAK